MNNPNSGLLRLAALVALCGVILSACAPTQVAISARFPANYPAAAELHRIVVGDFNGRGSDTFVMALRAELTNATFDGGRHFTIMESAGRGDAVQDARRVGAEGVILGDTDVTSSNENYTTLRTRCVARDNDGDCVRTQQYEVGCTRRTIQVSAAPRMVRASDGQVVYSQQRSANTQTRWCTDEQRRLSDDAMVSNSFAQVAAAVRRDVAPYNAVLNATVKESADGLPRATQATFTQAVDAAEAGDIASACRIWGEIDTANPNHVWTVYNLGICAEANGDYQTAATNYRRASDLGGAGDRAVQDSINRVGQIIGAERQLAAEEEARLAVAEAAQQRAAAEQRRVEQAREARRAELVSRYGAATADHILAGRIVNGMTPEQVLAARGQPTRREQLTPTDELWHYGSERVGFTNGRVTFTR